MAGSRAIARSLSRGRGRGRGPSYTHTQNREASASASAAAASTLLVLVALQVDYSSCSWSTTILIYRLGWSGVLEIKRKWEMTKPRRRFHFTWEKSRWRSCVLSYRRHHVRLLPSPVIQMYVKNEDELFLIIMLGKQWSKEGALCCVRCYCYDDLMEWCVSSLLWQQKVQYMSHPLLILPNSPTQADPKSCHVSRNSSQQPLTMRCIHQHELDREALGPFFHFDPERMSLVLRLRHHFPTITMNMNRLQFGLGNEPTSSLSSPDCHLPVTQFTKLLPFRALTNLMTCFPSTSHSHVPTDWSQVWRLSADMYMWKYFALFSTSHIITSSRQEGHKGEWLLSHLCNRLSDWCQQCHLPVYIPKVGRESSTDVHINNNSKSTSGSVSNKRNGGYDILLESIISKQGRSYHQKPTGSGSIYICSNCRYRQESFNRISLLAN